MRDIIDMNKRTFRKIVKHIDRGDYLYNCPSKEGVECCIGYGDFDYVTDDPYPMGQFFCEGHCPRMKHFDKMYRRYVKKKNRNEK